LLAVVLVLVAAVMATLSDTFLTTKPLLQFSRDSENSGPIVQPVNPLAYKLCYWKINSP
jgi:hypothetical protein